MYFGDEKLKKNKKLAIVLPDLRGGGAERISVNLANELVRRGISIDMALLSANGQFLSDLVPDVKVIDLKVRRMRDGIWPLVRYMRQARPDAMLVCMWPLTVMGLLARLFSGVDVRVVVAEHNTWSAAQAEYNLPNRFLIKWSMRLFFRSADGVVAVSHGAASDLVGFAHLPSDSVTTIYNPVISPKGTSEASLERALPVEAWHGAKFKLLNVGTLKTQKNQALLIRALALFPNRTDVHLLILGEGALRAELEALVKTLGLEAQVSMPGFATNPEHYFSSADLFVLSSDWEGLPTVVIEALAAGTPVVSTDCPSGPREILADGLFGRLVPVGDAPALAAAMAESLADTHDRAALKARAQDFSIDKAVDQYLQLLVPGSAGEGAA